MIDNRQLHRDSFFKDTHGKIVLWQWPNIPLLGWIIFKLLSMLPIADNLKAGSGQMSAAFLFTWAFLEITKGVNNFRRLLGIAVMITLVVSYFK